LGRLLDRLGTHPVGGLLATRVSDTLKRTARIGGGADPPVTETVERSDLWRALTPQMFRFGPLCAALDRAHAAGRFPSDEAQALEWLGERPVLVEGDSMNLKITLATVLGAAGLGDIGQHCGDTDPRWRGADSSVFVTQVLALLRDRRLAVANVDVTVLAQAPKIATHRDAMRRRIAQLLEVAAERVNIKATTTEGLGFLGRAEGIAAQAVVLLTEP